MKYELLIMNLLRRHTGRIYVALRNRFYPVSPQHGN